MLAVLGAQTSRLPSDMTVFRTFALVVAAMVAAAAFAGDEARAATTRCADVSVKVAADGSKA